MIRLGVCVCIFSLLLPSVALGKFLGVPVIGQEQTNWCWAGCAKAVRCYYSSPVNQCDFVIYACQRRGWCSSANCDTCCTNPGNATCCNKSNCLYGANGCLGDLLSHWSINSSGSADELSLATVRSEINDNLRPFIINWYWTSGGGHYIVARGIDASDNVYYMNPLPVGTGSYNVGTYSWMVSSSDHTWEYSLRMTSPRTGSAVSVSAQLHNGDSQQRTATGLSYKIRIRNPGSQTLEGANAGSPYWFIMWDISSAPPLGISPTITSVVNPDYHAYGFDISYSGITVPFCQTITLNFSGILNSWNGLSLEDTHWYYGGQGGGGAPNFGYGYPYPGEIAYGSGVHTTYYSIYNADDYYPITINMLQFSLAQQWYEPYAQWQPIGIPIGGFTGPYMLPPHSDLTISLPNIPDSTDSYIYTAGVIEYDMNGFLHESMQFRHGHREEIPPHMVIPELSPAGMWILMVIILTMGTYWIRKERY